MVNFACFDPALVESQVTGLEVIERLHFLASLPLAGTGQRQGGEKTQPFNRFQPRLGSWLHGPSL